MPSTATRRTKTTSPPASRTRRRRRPRRTSALRRRRCSPQKQTSPGRPSSREVPASKGSSRHTRRSLTRRPPSAPSPPASLSVSSIPTRCASHPSASACTTRSAWPPTTRRPPCAACTLPPLPPSRGRGQDAAARGAALTGRPRGHRRRAPRAHQRAVCPTAQPGDRRALCGAARDRDALSRDEAASRLRREGLLAQLCCGRRPAAIIPTCQESWYRPPKPRTLSGYGPLARTSTKRAEFVDVRSIEAQSATDSVTRSPAPPARRATDPAPP